MKQKIEKLASVYEFASSLPEDFHKIFNKLDSETKRHSIRCAQYLCEIEFLSGDIAHAALLHDLGKLLVPMNILTKKGMLTEDEWYDIQMHPVNGAKMIEHLNIEEPLKTYAWEMAMYHHERWNGSGYPLGLKGDQIPYCARVMAIIDTFDAMTSRRCYQKKVSKAESLELIRKQGGILFDPELVNLIKPQKLISL